MSRAGSEGTKGQKRFHIEKGQKRPKISVFCDCSSLFSILSYMVFGLSTELNQL